VAEGLAPASILVDLERQPVVDVLAVRTADAVAAWLAAHADIVIISRDRHGPYAEAVRLERAHKSAHTQRNEATARGMTCRSFPRAAN
jgi:hypothetical protein